MDVTLAGSEGALARPVIDRLACWRKCEVECLGRIWSGLVRRTSGGLAWKGAVLVLTGLLGREAGVPSAGAVLGTRLEGEAALVLTVCLLVLTLEY
jgi:hypothetical protein